MADPLKTVMENVDRELNPDPAARGGPLRPAKTAGQYAAGNARRLQKVTRRSRRPEPHGRAIHIARQSPRLG